jgi:hypothetical protein
VVGEDEFRDEVPKGVHRFERDMRRPLIPRRRVATCSFHWAQLRSMEGIMDCATSSRTNVRTDTTSDSKIVDVGSSRSSAASVNRVNIEFTKLWIGIIYLAARSPPTPLLQVATR